jgi:hypothetical protein
MAERSDYSMTEEERRKLSRLHELQGQWQDELNTLTGRMGDLADAPISIPQERWDCLLAADEDVRGAM